MSSYIKRNKPIVIALAVWAGVLAVLMIWQSLRSPDPEPVKAADGIAKLEAEEQRIEQRREEERQTKVQIQGAKRAEVGKSAPSFTLPGDGGDVSLADLRGKPVMLMFFASWCPHCQKMAPIVADVVRKHPKVQLVMISAAQEDRATVRKFHNSFLPKPMPGKLAYDDTLNVARAYGLGGYPTFAFIDAKGVLRETAAGERTVEEMERMVASIGA